MPRDDTVEGPANDAFIDPQRIDPRRRILRARRPPLSAASRAFVPRRAFISLPPVASPGVSLGDTHGATASGVGGGAATGNNDGEKMTSTVDTHVGSDSASGGVAKRRCSIRDGEGELEDAGNVVSGMSEDICRPGGSIYRDADFRDYGTVAGSGWSVSQNDSPPVPNNPFVNANDNAGGWGVSSDLDGSTWTPNMGETESVVKHDPDTFVDLHTDNNAMDSTIEGTGEEAAVWFMERVCVQLKKNSAQAVIKEINGSQAVVEFEDKSTQTVRNGEVTMVPPQEHDLVLVTGGADVGVEGELVCIDGTDAVLKVSNENFKIVDFVHLAKIASDYEVEDYDNEEEESEVYDEDDDSDDASDDDSDDASDDDSDDDDLGPFPLFFQGFMNELHAGQRLRTNLGTRIRPDDDNEESDDDDNGIKNCARCAACFRSGNQNHKWRCLVTLPCCGANGRENNSSTRFCAGCILKLAVTRAHPSSTDEYRLVDDEPNHWPVKKFYQESGQSDNRRFIQCPRCRDVLLVKIKGIKPTSDSESSESESEGDCDCSDCEAERRERAYKETAKTARSISVHAPSIMAKCWHLGRKRGGAKLLWKVSLLHHNFISFEALGGDSEKPMIERLAGYGVLEKIPGKRNKSLYRIDKETQAKIINLFHLENPSEKEREDQYKLMAELSGCSLYAAWRHMTDDYRIDRSLRSLNREFFITFHTFGLLPPLPLSWPQELVCTALALFLTTLAAQFLCILIVYAFVFVGVGLSASYVLKRSKNIKSCWWQVTLVSFFLYRLCKFFYGNPYLSWGILVSPKATIPVKKVLWG